MSVLALDSQLFRNLANVIECERVAICGGFGARWTMFGGNVGVAVVKGTGKMTGRPAGFTYRV